MAPKRAQALFPVVVGNPPEAVLLRISITTEQANEPIPRRLLASAHRAVLNAFQAASQVVGRGIAPRAFHEHRILIDCADGTQLAESRVREIDGESIGLAAFVAFARVWLGWTGRFPRAAFSGRLERQDPTGSRWDIGAVESIDNKLSACKDHEFFIPESCRSTATERANAHHARDLAGAFAETLGLTNRAFVTPMSREHWRDKVREANRVVMKGSPTAMIGDVLEPWKVLSLHIEQLLKHQPSDPTRLEIREGLEAEVWMLVARQYAGERVDATELNELRRKFDGYRDRREVESPLGLEITQVLDALVTMCTLIREINDEAVVPATVNQACACLPTTHGVEIERLLGRFLGTIGRALTRLGRHDEAIDYLTKALQHHKIRDHESLHEVPRSTLYLAQAQFHAGNVEAAKGNLRNALDIIGCGLRGDGDRDYLTTTKMFVAHALAKTLAVSPSTERDVNCTGEGEQMMEEADKIWADGKWPAQLRIKQLRTHAWLAHAANDADVVNARVREIDELIIGLKRESQPASERIRDEAMGQPTYRGIVD